MANFDDAIEVTLQFEGGYVNDAADPGGETNFGISKRSYPNEDIKNLTVERAKEIYRADYWRSLYDRIDSQAVATKLFDMGVNMGIPRAVKILQAFLSVAVDGAFGPGTLAAVNNAGDMLLDPYKQGLAAYYRRLVAQKPEMGKFLKGWLRRVNA